MRGQGFVIASILVFLCLGAVQRSLVQAAPLRPGPQITLSPGDGSTGDGAPILEVQVDTFGATLSPQALDALVPASGYMLIARLRRL